MPVPSRAIVVVTGEQISPFQEPPSDALYASSTVGGAFAAACARLGIEIVRVRTDEAVPAGGPAVVIADACFVSDKCLADFLAVAGALPPSPSGKRLALARTPSVDFARPVSSVVIEPFDASGPGAAPPKRRGAASRAEGKAIERAAYDCFFVDNTSAEPAGPLLERLRRDAQRVVVPKKELGVPIRLPVLGAKEATQSVVPITSTVAVHVEHWVHVLWLNQLAWGIRWNEIVRAHPVWAALRVLRGALSLSFASVVRAFVRRGNNVRIHPTAHVEGSILGDNVVIGARASVRNSILGAGVEVGDHATVLSSTVGDGSFITPRTFLVWSATYPGAVISNYKLQVSLVGRGASLSTWAGLIDAKLQGTVEVKKGQALLSTEKSFLGSCIGHGAYVGAKVLLLPGREVPNGAFISMRPDELITEVPKDLPTGVPLVRDAGTLVPLDRLLPAPPTAR